MGNDHWVTGDGNDVLDAGGGNDTVNAGAGDDVIIQKDNGFDQVNGGDGIDRLVIDYSGEMSELNAVGGNYYGGRGIWAYYYDAAGNYLGLNGVEYEAPMPVNTAAWGLYSYHNRVTYRSIEQFDMTGTMYMDYLVGGSYDDVLRGNGGNDVLLGGDGADLLEGGNGNDRLDGGDGDDTLSGGAGNDQLQTGDSRNSDHLDGGDGTDILVADLAWCTDDVILDNDPTVVATLPGGATYIGIEEFRLSTGTGNDDLRNTRTTGNDNWITGAGNDVLDAGGGNDTLDAGSGDDVIIQKDSGFDQVNGGDGIDRLVIDYSGEMSEFQAVGRYFGGRGIWAYYYDAAGNYLGLNGVEYEAPMPVNTAAWGTL